MKQGSIATRDAFGDALAVLGERFPKLFVIDCDVGKSMKTGSFAEKFPERHINVGIAEQNAAGIAAGLAAQGKLPVISTYAVFGSMRMLEQVRTSICYPNLHVIVACGHGGLTSANDGVTHQAIEDMGIYRTIPNMTVVMPADYHSTRVLLEQAIEATGPIYIRFTRDPIPVLYNEKDRFTLGCGKLLRKGRDVTLIAVGDIVSQALRASELLVARGIDVGVADIHTVKPIDRELIMDCLEKTGRIVTVEDHSKYNGLGSAVCEIAAEMGRGRVIRLGLDDTFGESGTYEQLLRKYGLDAESIAEATLRLL